MDRFHNGNGGAEDNTNEVLEFVEEAVLVEEVEIAAVQIALHGGMVTYAVTLRGKLGDGSGDEAERKVMLSTGGATELINGLVQAAAKAEDTMFMVALMAGSGMFAGGPEDASDDGTRSD